MEGENRDLLSVPEKKTAGNWAVENVLNPMVNAGPLAVYNTAADLVNLPTVHLHTAEAQPYSANWFVQGVSHGLGAAVPFMIAGAGAKYAMNKASETAIGATIKPLLTSNTAHMVTGAMAFSALQKPDENHTRFGNAMGAGLGFLVFSGGNALAKDMSTLGKVLTLPAVGFAGGATMAEASQLFSNGKLASKDEVLQSAVQGMAMNSVMGAAGEFARRHEAKVDKAQADYALRKLQQIQEQEGPDTAILLKNDKGVLAKVPTDINRLIAESRDYSDWVKQNKVQYPTIEEFAKMSKDDIAKRGFLHPDLHNLENIGDLIEALKDRKPRPLPDAKVVASEVREAVKHMPKAAPKGDLILGEWNMEFLDASKAKYFAETYKEVVPRHHLLFVIEADKGGLAQIAKDNPGYRPEISPANSRGQAVGFLINERLKINGTKSYAEVADINNIPDLRPAFRLDFTDTASGKDASAVVVHLKSMRGGPEQTAPVRAAQAAVLAQVLGPNFKGIVGGDFNTFLERSKDMDPLVKAGFKLLNPNDTNSTQAMGGRLDGFYVKGMEGFSDPSTIPFWKNKLITRGLSDHALVTTRLKTGT